MLSEIAVLLEHGKKWHGENYLKLFVWSDISVHIFTCAAQIYILNNFHSLSLSSLHLVTGIPFFALDLTSSALLHVDSYHLKLECFCSHGFDGKLSLELWCYYLCTFCVEKTLKQPSVIHSDTYGGFEILRMSYFQNCLFHLLSVQFPECVHRPLE